MTTVTETFRLPAHFFKLSFGVLLLFIALLVLGFGLDIFPGQRRGMPAEMIAAGLFGSLLLWLGGFLLHRGTVRVLALAKVPPGFLPGRLIRFFGRRITSNTLLAGWPYLLLSGQLGYFWSSGNPWPAGSGAELAELYYLEFGVIHTTLFLGLISLVPASGWGRPVKYLLFLLFCGFYGWAMLGRLTFYGYVSYLFLLAGKFGGYYLRPPSANRRLALFLRWGLQFCTFLLIASALGNEKISGFANVPCGFWYFLLLGLYEILDFFSVDTDPAVGRVPCGPLPESQ
jgi:hypothetical protein